MSVTIELRFPWGRVHATPWERSANEAEPEWPLSSWRLLRALYSVWRFRCPDLEGDVIERLLGALAVAPSYRLPPHTIAHTRHYFPAPNHRSGQSGATDKVFDAFVVIPADEPVQLRWGDVDLDPEALSALARLLSELPFLGRAESLCDASIVKDPVEGDWIAPLRPDEPLDGRRLVSVLAPTAPLDIPCLLATTKQVRSAGFIDPPGSQRVRYPLPVRHEIVFKPHRRRKGKPTLAVLGVYGNVLPSFTASLVMCELLRLAVQSKFGDLTGGRSSPTLSGKLADGQRRLGQHNHAHYLSLPRALEGRFIDRFVIWAPEGLDRDEVRAINALRELNPGIRAKVDGGKELRRVDVRLEAIGGIEEVLIDGLTGRSTRWRSITPFITSRHISNSARRRLKGDDEPWLGFLAQEVRREAEMRDLHPIQVTPHRRRADGSSWLAFRRHRAFKPEKLAAAPRGSGFDLEFSEPVSGPIALGALSHFGLGLFLPFPEDP